MLAGLYACTLHKKAGLPSRRGNEYSYRSPIRRLRRRSARGPNEPGDPTKRHRHRGCPCAGADLKAWWSRVEAGETRIERFELFPATPGSEPVWGFFGEALVQGQNVPVMGDVVDAFFDQPRVPPPMQRQAAHWMREQVEEFALHYWLRAEAAALPQPYPELGHAAAAPFLSWLSLCFPADQEFSGYGNVQRLFKLRAGGRVGEFPLPERRAIIDLRELESTYAWITLDTREFDFNITIGGAGNDAPNLVLPLTTIVHCVASADSWSTSTSRSPGRWRPSGRASA